MESSSSSSSMPSDVHDGSIDVDRSMGNDGDMMIGDD
jgi:hypothetical protein